ncbi:MAG: Gfo/Idh/MocA family oxidoreductase [Acidobacteriota bacterium]
MIRVGIVGFGMAGRVFHAPLLSSVEGFRFAAVVERHLNEAESRYPGITTCRSLDEMLADRTLDLVVIATPSGTHFETARQVVAGGKHAVVDKPMATESREIAELAGLAQERGVRLFPFHNRRWDGDFLTVQHLLREGALGRLVHVESRMDRWNPRATRRPWKDDPEQGGGVLLDLGTHLVDQALVLFGRPLGVGAEVAREREGEGANDAFTIRLRYEGFGVTLGANNLSSPAGPRFVVRGTRGNYRKFGVDPQENALNKVTRIGDPNWGEESADAWGELRLDNEGGMVSKPEATIAGDYRRFYMAVGDALRGKPAPAPTVAEAWRVARVLELAQESSQTGCEVACDWTGEPKEEAPGR